MLKLSTEGKEQPLDSKNPKFIYYGNSVIYPFFNNTQWLTGLYTRSNPSKTSFPWQPWGL